MYSSKKEAGAYLGASNSTVRRYIKSGKLLFDKYLITEEQLYINLSLVKSTIIQKKKKESSFIGKKG